MEKFTAVVLTLEMRPPTPSNTAATFGVAMLTVAVPAQVPETVRVLLIPLVNIDCRAAPTGNVSVEITAPVLPPVEGSPPPPPPPHAAKTKLRLTAKMIFVFISTLK